MDELHISAVTVTLVGGLLTILLGIIAFFLSRLISQFDMLRDQFSELNATMSKIDKDLSGEVGILKNENKELTTKVKDLDPLWDRMRDVEKEVAVLRSTCPVHCKTGQ